MKSDTSWNLQNNDQNIFSNDRIILQMSMHFLNYICIILMEKNIFFVNNIKKSIQYEIHYI